MSQKISLALISGFTFIGISIPVLALILTTFAYLEWFSSSTISKLIYASFVVIFFLGTTIVAKHVGEKGWLTGLAVSVMLISLTLLYYTIGLETALTFQVFIRCCITLVICLTGGMIGVNLSASKNSSNGLSNRPGRT